MFDPIPRVQVASVKPYWLPDTKGFLAISIVILVAVIVLILLVRPITMDERSSNLLSTILGILIGCFKDIYSHFFGSTQASQDKDKTIASMGADLAVSAPVAAVSTTATATATPARPAEQGEPETPPALTLKTTTGPAADPPAAAP